MTPFASGVLNYAQGRDTAGAQLTVTTAHGALMELLAAGDERLTAPIPRIKALHRFLGFSATLGWVTTISNG